VNTLTLYQLSDKYRQLEVLADTGDIPPEVIRDTLDALGGELEEKAVAVAHFIRNLETAAESIETAASAMSLRAERMRERASSIRAYLLFHMQATRVPKVFSPYFTIAIRTNPPSVVIDDASVVPAEYKVIPTVEPRIDRLRIAARIKAGEPVPGCRLETKQRLEIKA